MLAPLLAASWFPTFWDLASGLFLWLGLLIALVLLPAILLSQKLPQAKVAWILAVTGFPWIGSAFYLTFGRRDLRRKILRIKSLRRTGAEVHRSKGLLRRLRLRLRVRRPSSSEMIGAAERAGAEAPILGNSIRLLADGGAAFAAGGAAIRNARSHVHLLTYIFKNDSTGRGTVRLLSEAARSGVEVRLLYDGAGTFRTASRFFAPVKEAGGKVSSFLPISPFIPGWRLNLRNHRKLLIVDGEVALTGGMNIGDEYAINAKWKDLHVEVRGPVVPSLQRVFAQDWHTATGEALDDARYFPAQPEAGEVPIQVMASGPDQIEPLAPELLFGAITAARETIDIMTPYLVPTDAIEQALRSAARRGRRVRILVPGFVDSRIVRLASDTYVGRLIDAGVRIWRHPHMSHGKMIVVDGAWATLGSTNLDMRSLWLNFELNIAIPHAATAQELVRHFERELAVSTRLTHELLEAGWPTRLGRAFAHLLSPLL